MISHEDIRFGLYSFLTLTLAAGKWSVHNQILSPRGKPHHRHLRNRRCLGFRNQSGRSEIEKNILPLQGIEPRFLGPPAHSLVIVPNGLSQLKDHWLLHEILNILFL